MGKVTTAIDLGFEIVSVLLTEETDVVPSVLLDVVENPVEWSLIRQPHTRFFLAPHGVRGELPEISMGHRALIAYERPTGQYNLHYSHWGGLSLRLKHDLTEDRPFGGDQHVPDLEDAFCTALEARTLEDVWVPAERPSTQVDIQPLAVGVSLNEILIEHVNYFSHEAFYVVDSEFSVTAYRTLWFGLQYESRKIESSPLLSNGAIRTIRWFEGEPVADGYVRGRFQGLKDVAGEMIDRGVLTEAEAVQYLEDSLHEWRGEEELWIRVPEQRQYLHSELG